MTSKYAANKTLKVRERSCEEDRDLVFGNRMCKNMLARETGLVLCDWKSREFVNCFIGLCCSHVGLLYRPMGLTSSLRTATVRYK